jgi:hypothetical protein
MQIPSSIRLALAAAAAAGVAGSLAAGAPTGTASGRDTGSWCALVIKINTSAGYMKNKHYGKLTPQIFKAVIVAGQGSGARLVAAAPASIKAATQHEVAWLAKVKANGYNPATPGGAFTAADARKLIAFQHAHCGITGP